MPVLPLLQIDAFTTEPLSGNPCAVIFDADELSVEMMQKIAREMNLSETAFVMASDNADFRARYFTPVEEIPLAGHPTIATTHALVESGRFPFSGGSKIMQLELQVGIIPVKISGQSAQEAIYTMSQKKPQFLKSWQPEQVCPAFGLTAADLLPDVPIQTVSTGTPQLMIPVKNQHILHAIELDIPRYIELRANGDFFSTHIFCLPGLEKGQTFARHFVTPPDLIEDPFTGSATGGMGAYLWHYGIIDSPIFVAEQGHWMGRPGRAQVEVIGQRSDIETVKVGGPAKTVVRGELLL
ncbi:MAG: PhzF family phenazine biosynthesis protein [Calditrichaeota bacterium]|nr:MAG: PhzF family phenazine biosynthesis protein [Calditrichota bacterium]